MRRECCIRVSLKVDYYERILAECPSLQTIAIKDNILTVVPKSPNEFMVKVDAFSTTCD